MITELQYFGVKINHPEVTEEKRAAAVILLARVNGLLDEAREAGVYGEWIDPDTGTQISGSKGGQGDGGFRLSNSSTGSPTSPHKRAAGVDVFDPAVKLNAWISTFDTRGGAGNTLLERHQLWRESPDFTPTWCHLQSIAPGSGRRTYRPY
jgi:hypothetical protein